jgi:UDP-N-acetylglucosamine 4,6-dehydratase/5-epimerase
MIRTKQRTPVARETVSLLRPVPAGPALKAAMGRAQTRSRGLEDALREFDGKAVLVTGGTGSFGRRFVDTLLHQTSVQRLIVFSRDEYKQYEMQQHIPTDEAKRMRFFIGDVRDAERLELATRDVDVIIHAAALKQVPAAEYNPFECIRTNVSGAENVVRAALRNGVKRVIALSTDKAANPINLYGASKLASDKIFIAANNLAGKSDIRFSVVRYGNVVGSRGSVIPLYRKLVDEGAEYLPVTDERMTRFWITLQQGVEFVVTALTMMQGGEIFVPKIPSMTILDLARCLGPGLPIKIVGIRPGEKLHEVMVTEDDSRQTLEIADRYIIEPSFAWWRRESYIETGAVPVPQSFRFASDTNTDWLDAGRLEQLLLAA